MSRAEDDRLKGWGMYQFFSVDDHIIEPPSVWVDRVPAKYRDVAPHIVDEGGVEYWEYEDTRAPTIGLAAAAGRPPEEWSFDPIRFEQMRRGCYDPAARTEDLLSNGVLASITFPTLPRFAGVLFTEFEDKALADVCVRAYNDFIIDEWCAGGPPGLYVPTVMCQLWDPVLAAAEIRRTAALGAKALTFPENTAPLGLPSYWTDHWEPVWDAAEETGIVFCLHIGTSGQFPAPSPEAPESLGFSLLSTQSYTAAVNLMWSPVCRRHPKLKFVFAEGGIGWLPTALEHSDHKWKTDRPYRGFDETLPSEIFRQNMWLCLMEEPVALRYRDAIGIDKILWECDYPHPDSLWPKSQELADEYFAGAGCTEDEIRRISHENAEAVFGWKIAAPDLLATSGHGAGRP